MALPIPYSMGTKIQIQNIKWRDKKRCRESNKSTFRTREAIKIFNKYKYLKQKIYWEKHFLARGYCVDTVGLDSEMIRKYVKHQEKNERKVEQQRKLF